tara:strand:- start:328 stop:1548 length:1221 start_codon:yes stop_codon:yes gene_type:complete
MEKLLKSVISILVLVRILFLQISTKSSSIYLTKDSDHYIGLSKDIVYFFFNDNLSNYWLSTFRLPGYPVLLNIFSRILEIKNIIYLNLVADLIVLYLLYKLLFIYFEKTYCYIGCILFLINTNVLISSSQIMTESFSTLFFFASFYFYKVKKYLVSSIFISLLSIFKPLGVYLIILYIILMIFEEKKLVTNIIKISFIPICVISSIYFNNFVQYETSFYSTSSYFHLQWLNEASNSICKDGDFNSPIVSEPGYVFENWLQKNQLTTSSDSNILINKLKADSSGQILDNFQCKAYSMARSSIWNMFGIRRANWNGVGLNSITLNFIIYFSLIYVIIINSIFIFSIFKSLKKRKLNSYIFVILFYMIITSTLPFGNSRTRVLIEPFLIVLLIDSVKNVVSNKLNKSYL